jgi:hypothetical protein
MVRPCKKGGDYAVAGQRGLAIGLAGGDHFVGIDGYIAFVANAHDQDVPA